MRTISSLCATSAAVSASSIGLAFARVDHREGTQDPHSMTELAQHNFERLPIHANPYSSFVYSTPVNPGRYSAGLEEDGRKPFSFSAGIEAKKSRDLPPREVNSAGMERTRRRLYDEEDADGEPTLLTSRPSAPPQTWLRRLSSHKSGSRDSSREGTRPKSVAVSHSNGSFAFSQAESTMPMLLSKSPPPLPPNKLVKRAPSVTHARAGSPGLGSRLPLPVLKRPATSHQRESMLRDAVPSFVSSSALTMDDDLQGSEETQWRHHFTPQAIVEDRPAAKRPRTSSGIPNPVRRVLPDRRHTPVLIAAGELTRPPKLEYVISTEPDDFYSPTSAAGAPLPFSTPSSPSPPQDSFAPAQTPRRSFSIGDLLSSGSQPIWKRPASSRSRASFSRQRQARTVSMPATTTPFAKAFQAAAHHDFTPDTKPHGHAHPRKSSHSIDSSSSSIGPFAALSHDVVDFDQLNDARLSSSPPSVPSHASSINQPAEALQNQTSLIYNSSTIRPSRISSAYSEPASTVDSESEFRSLGDASTDYQSDHLFDSIPTRVTGSGSSRRRPHIETLFDESPPDYSSGRSNKLRDFLSDGQTPVTDRNAYRHSTIEEEGSVVSTPVRSIHNLSLTATPSARQTPSKIYSSSPPTMNLLVDGEDLDWDLEDNIATTPLEGRKRALLLSANGTPVNKSMPFKFGPALRFIGANSAGPAVQRNLGLNQDRPNPFDWSEPQPSPGQNTNSPPRPKTVHGKKDQDGRGSRPGGRRPVSGMHARSHSVPVVPDVDGKRNNLVANKFGTWGVGSKGVTEDWDEDFDFTKSEDTDLPMVDTTSEGRRIDSGQNIRVPPRVKASQDNVVANIGLLREWGLLIEELKELRTRAVNLDILHDEQSQPWCEVDAMIELADQESEELTLEPSRSPPSSPGFDYDAFEEPNGAGFSRSRQSSFNASELPRQPSETAHPPVQVQSRQGTPITRPRKDSELVAQNVIAALQSRRSNHDLVDVAAGSRAKKVPFDTTTLRAIVPYVNALKRKVKDALREAEGLYESPARRDSPSRRSTPEHEPSFRRIFNDNSNDTSASRQRVRRGRAATDLDAPESPSTAVSASLARRMQKLTLPSTDEQPSSATSSQAPPSTDLP